MIRRIVRSTATTLIIAATPQLSAQPSPLPLQAGTFTYATRVDQGISARNDRDRVVTVSEVTHDGVPAWRVTLFLDTGEGVLVDTLLMRRDDLAPDLTARGE